VQVEDISRVCLTPRRTAKQQRQLSVCSSLFGKIIVYAERVLPLVHEVLRHRCTRIRRDVLHRSRAGSRRADDDGVIHRTFTLEPVHHSCDGRALLPHRHIDADHITTSLVDDGIDGDGSLADSAVTDDQLPLTSADGNRRVDRLDTALQWLVYRLSVRNPRCRGFHWTVMIGLDRTFPVERITQRVHDPSEQRLAAGNLQDGSGPLDFIPLLEGGELSENHGSYGIFLQVECETTCTVGKGQHLSCHAVRDAVDPGDTVSHLEDGSDLIYCEVRLVIFDLLLENRGDFVGINFHRSGLSRIEFVTFLDGPSAIGCEGYRRQPDHRSGSSIQTGGQRRLFGSR